MQRSTTNYGNRHPKPRQRTEGENGYLKPPKIKEIKNGRWNGYSLSCRVNGD